MCRAYDGTVVCTPLKNSVLVFFRIRGQRPSAKAKCLCEVLQLDVKETVGLESKQSGVDQ